MGKLCAGKRGRRLNFIERHIDDPIEEIVVELQREGLCSCSYSLKCLYMDIWYIVERPRIPRNVTVKQNENFVDGFIHIYLEVIIQALQDIATGRPCDVDLWSDDDPPGAAKESVCTPYLHICADHAEIWLGGISGLEEEAMGLESGTISFLIDNVKEETQKRVSSIYELRKKWASTRPGKSPETRLPHRLNLPQPHLP